MPQLILYCTVNLAVFVCKECGKLRLCCEAWRRYFERWEGFLFLLSVPSLFLLFSIHIHTLTLSHTPEGSQSSSPLSLCRQIQLNLLPFSFLRVVKNLTSRMRRSKGVVEPVTADTLYKRSKVLVLAYFYLSFHSFWTWNYKWSEMREWLGVGFFLNGVLSGSGCAVVVETRVAPTVMWACLCVKKKAHSIASIHHFIS